MHKYSSVIIVEDQLSELRKYEALCQNLRLRVTTASSAKEAIAKINAQTFDLALVDLHLSKDQSDISGIGVISEFSELWPCAPVLAMSSDFHETLCQKALASGAQHFLRKPIVSSTELNIAFKLAYERKQMLLENEKKLGFVPTNSGAQGFRQRFPYGLVLAEEHLKAAQIVSQHPQVPFIIFGETGTGKEEIAKLVHQMRVQKEGVIPFVTVNCASLSHDLVESLLFGHRKGAFTGADRSTAGFLGEANGGILFLDEIHCLGLEVQARLLRVLNNGSYHRLGDTAELYSHFQVIVASTVDLDDLVDEGKFILDLRSRLTGIDLLLKPLRRRLHELSAFIEFFFLKRNVAVSQKTVLQLADKCSQYYWRGNIRQLYKALEILLITAECHDEMIGPDLLPEFKTMLPPKTTESDHIDQASRKNSDVQESEISLSIVLDDGKDLKTLMDELEAMILKESSLRYPRMADQCRYLGISRSTLDFKRRKYRLK